MLLLLYLFHFFYCSVFSGKNHYEGLVDGHPLESHSKKGERGFGSAGIKDEGRAS